MKNNFTTPIIILSGKHANRRGYICGLLALQNRHTTRVVVKFSADEWGTFEIKNVAPTRTIYHWENDQLELQYKLEPLT